MRTIRTALLFLLTANSNGLPLAADDWPAWRGPRGDGISLEQTAPLEWSVDRGIAWKTAIPGIGRSSPIVAGDRVFVTTGTADDAARRVLCLNRGSGEILWNTVVHQGAPGKMHQDNTTASSTPAADGSRVYAVFVDDVGLTAAALDLNGNVLWKTSPGTFYSNHGFAASPVLYGPGVIINGQQDGTAFVTMLDRQTGAELWRYMPEVNLRSFSTPVLTQHEGRDLLILTGSQHTAALEPATGKLIWSVRGPSEKFVCTPSVGHGMVFSFAGSPDKKSLAVRLGGTGDVTETHVAWRSERGMPYVPSPLLVGNYLHVVNDLGVYSCIEPVSGEVLHTARALGSTYSSPVAAAGRIYMFEDTGRCTIFENRPGFHVLARNELGEEVYTTPAVASGQLFVRSVGSLFCIGEPR
ncbi:MAG: PQQ-binding-like beta-propeller repeat protein [Planctomycetaceae bacterium]